MKTVIQRVASASVAVDGKIVGQITQGVLILLGIFRGDTRIEADYLTKKIVEFRMFRDQQQRMNKSLLDIRGQALVVSQFTLVADGKKGKRPSFDRAAPPEQAESLYEYFIQSMTRHGIDTSCGRFGAYMQVNLINDGPVTFILEKAAPD